MGKEPSTAAEEAGGKSFFKELSSAAAKKALTPMLAAAATAGTTYLTRKTTQLWQDEVLPKVREKGGGRAVAKEALEKVAGRLSGSPARRLADLAESLGDGEPSKPAAAQHSIAEGDASESKDSGSTESDQQREKERRQRQQRRQQRQRALQKSAST